MLVKYNENKESSLLDTKAGSEPPENATKKVPFFLIDSSAICCISFAISSERLSDVAKIRICADEDDDISMNTTKIA